MHRTDGAGHVNNLFVNEDPATNQPPTEVTPEILNAFQEELASVIEAAQIVLNKANNTQLLAALRSAGVFQTQPQFDNTTKVCTTAHAKAAGKRFGGVVSIAANGALTAAYIGKLTLVSGNGLLVDLPAANTVPAGECVSLLGAGWASASTIQRFGTDVIYPDGIGGGITSFLLNYGDTITLVSNGANAWYVADSSAMRGVGCSAQSWQNVAASRAINTNYTNSTGRPILVSFGATATGATGFYALYVDGLSVTSTNVAAGMDFTLNAIVPAGKTYQLSKGGGDTTTSLHWHELK